MRDLKTILINNNPAIVQDAQKAGVARIMVDLESHGKKERQASRTTFLSTHTKEDIAPIRKVVTTAELMVRVNPFHAGTKEEINHAIGEGADLIMLPMITNMDHFQACLDIIGGRAKPMPLVETAYSMAHISHIIENPAIGEVFIGLNDLHLSLGLDFLFEPLGLGLLDWMANHIKAAGKPFGFGGITTLGSGELPAERILAEHVRMGSSAVILSSKFAKDLEIDKAEGRFERFKKALDAMQQARETFRKRTPQQQSDEQKATAELITALAAKARAKQSPRT